MQSKMFSIRTLLIVVLMGLIFSLAFLFYFTSQNLIQSDAVTLNVQEKTSFSLPVRLKIPKISIDAVVEYVGLTPKGAMDVPKDPSNVAWFNLGPRPGENGSAVIAGHYGWKNGIPAAFDYLYKLRKGDKLYIEDDKGAIISFVVRESRTYGENEDASGVFGSSDGKVHLNLITCEGVWDKTQKSYSNRLVVFTDKG